jgi:hypothetical protein
VAGRERNPIFFSIILQDQEKYIAREDERAGDVLGDFRGV